MKQSLQCKLTEFFFSGQQNITMQIFFLMTAIHLGNMKSLQEVDSWKARRVLRPVLSAAASGVTESAEKPLFYLDTICL